MLSPLDFTRLATLPPARWMIRPYEGGVLIAAWVDEANRIYWHKFDFSPSLAEILSDKPLG